jgi:DNA-binding transcriptional LysR family regulator
MKELSGEPFVMFPRRKRPTLHDRIVAECQRAGFGPRVAQEAGEIQALLGLVAAGFGVALTLESFEKLKRPGVVYRSLENQTELLNFAVAWRRADESPVLLNFLEVVQEIAVSSDTEKQHSLTVRSDTLTSAVHGHRQGPP